MADQFFASGNQDYSDFYKGQMAPPVQQGTGLVQSGWGQSQPTDVVRVTPEGLNVRSVNTVPIGADGNPGGWGGTDAVDTSSPLQYDMLADQFGLNNQGSIPGPNGYTIADKGQDRLSAGQPGNLFAYGNEGVGSPAQNAIAAALSGGVGLPRRDPRGYLAFSGAPNFLTGTAGQGDAWAGTRFGEPVSVRPGFGPAPVGSVAAALVPAPVAQHQNVTANDGMNATQRFLSDRGASSGGTIGQQANELNKLLGGRD